MLPKRKYPDYQEITQDNFPQIMQDMERLVYKWIRRTPSPKHHWAGMIFRFWEHVWVKHELFDRKKGALTTWLGWQWISYYGDCSRHGKKFGDVPLPGTGPGSGKRVKGIFVAAAGLNPEWHALPDWGVSLNKDTDEEDRHKLRADTARSSYAERLLSTDTIDLNCKEDNQLFQEEYLRRVSPLLSPAERQLLEHICTQRNIRKIAKDIGISRYVAVCRVKALKDRLLRLAGHTTRETLGPPDVYWQEYFSQMLKTWPLVTNKYEDAEQARMRAQADHIRNSWIK